MANRWVWAYGMIIAYIVAVTWQDLCKIDIRKGLGIIIAIAVYSLAALLMMNEINHNIIFSLITALLIVIACIIGNKSAKKLIAPVLAIILVFASFAGKFGIFFQQSRQ